MASTVNSTALVTQELDEHRETRSLRQRRNDNWAHDNQHLMLLHRCHTHELRQYMNAHGAVAHDARRVFKMRDVIAASLAMIAYWDWVTWWVSVSTQHTDPKTTPSSVSSGKPK